MMTLNFCEYNRFNQDYDRICRPSGSGDYLFLLLKTPMKVYLEDKLHITKENACILYTLQTPQHYQAVKRFCNSYLHFSSDINPCLRFGIPANTIFYPANYMEIDSLIRDLQQEYFSTADFREEYIHTLITQLFISISRTLTSSAVRSEDTGNLYPAFQSLRLQMLSDCRRTGPWNASARPSIWKRASSMSTTASSFPPRPKMTFFRSGWKKQKTC